MLCCTQTFLRSCWNHNYCDSQDIHQRDFMEAIRALFWALFSRGQSCSFGKLTLREFHGTMQLYRSSIIRLITTYSFPMALLIKKVRNNLNKFLGNYSTFSDYRIIVAYKKKRIFRTCWSRPGWSLVRLQDPEVVLGSIDRVWIRSQVHKFIQGGNPGVCTHKKLCILN